MSGGSAGLVLVLVLVFAALFTVAVLAIGSLRRSDQSRLLTAQIDRYGPRQAPAPDGGEGVVARRAVGGMTRLLRSSSVEPGLARRLDLAGIGRSPAEWAVLGGCASAGLIAVLTVLTGNLVLGVLLGVVTGWAAMRFTLTIRISRRRAAFADQLPDTLQLIAGSLQAGFSLPQALDAVVREDSQPVAGEFARALAEVRIGADLEDGLARVADRMNSTDLSWTVMAVRIQREVGGNLAEVLRNTVATMRERAALRRHVRALSAEGRLSAYILIALPILIAIWLFISSPGYMRPLYTTPVGVLMLIGGAVLMVVGSFWMSRVIKVEM
ncbi:MAG: type II secretion system F family protein [Gemmatimonadota bacterium]